MTLDLPGRHASRVHGDDLLVEARKPPLIPGDQLRVERAFPIARNTQVQLGILGQHRLLRGKHLLRIAPRQKLVQRALLDRHSPPPAASLWPHTQDSRQSLSARDCSQTMALPTSRPIWPNGWTIAIWGTCVAHPAIRKPRARSSAGIRRSRTASCSKSTICPATSKLKSVGSSITTTIAATTRA